MNTPYQSAQPVTDFGLGFSRLKYGATLAATTSTLFTVPGDSPRYKAVIQLSSTSPGWMALNKAAADPLGAAFSATDSEMIQASEVYCREVVAGDVIQFYHTAGGAKISVVLYSL